MLGMKQRSHCKHRAPFSNTVQAVARDRGWPCSGRQPSEELGQGVARRSGQPGRASGVVLEQERTELSILGVVLAEGVLVGTWGLAEG